MKNTMWKLENPIKHYDWGSMDQLSTLFGIANPNNEPQAEIWMGAHPSSPSFIVDADNRKISLVELINNNQTDILGERIDQQFHELPYLFKVLSAQKALSIQVHPQKSKAEIGFAKENQLNIAINAANRNYKDPNHKPELVYALTRYKAMNAFRPIHEIIGLFDLVSCSPLRTEIAALKSNPEPSQLKLFFKACLSLSPEQVAQIVNELLSSIEPNKDPRYTKEPFCTIRALATDYPCDIGLITPLILNVIELQPGEAMFLHAETPHAYIKGTGLEIMANSDNVLRAGLTPKFIDVDELIDNTKFNSIPASHLLTSPIYDDNKIDFPVPVADFKFEIINSDMQKRSDNVTGPEILFCISGNVKIETATDCYTIKSGESVFIACAAKQFTYQGEGILARAFC